MIVFKALRVADQQIGDSPSITVNAIHHVSCYESTAASGTYHGRSRSTLMQPAYSGDPKLGAGGVDWGSWSGRGSCQTFISDPGLFKALARNNTDKVEIMTDSSRFFASYFHHGFPPSRLGLSKPVATRLSQELTNQSVQETWFPAVRSARAYLPNLSQCQCQRLAMSDRQVRNGSSKHPVMMMASLLGEIPMALWGLKNLAPMVGI